MLLQKPQQRMKTYTISLTKEEREEIRRKRKHLSPFRKKFDDIERRGQIMRMRQRMGNPWDRCSEERKKVRKFY